MTDPTSRPSGASTEPARTLLLTFAIPDFHADDLPEQAGFYDGDMTAAVYEAAALISNTARLSIMSGDKGGNDLHSMRAVLVSASVVDRVPAHDEPEDERLTDALVRAGAASAEATPPPCPTGCGCRLWTEDADVRECACDGPCCWDSWDDFMADVLDRPDYYDELRVARGDKPSQEQGAEASE